MADIEGDGTAVTGLGGPSGYGEIALPSGDSGAVQVDLSAVFENGFVIDGVTYPADEVYISIDGFITFGTPVDAMPEDPESLDCPFIAVFMADVDTRLDGEPPESGQIWLDVDPVNDCVTITWEDVGFYRRNATETNTFQLQLYDNGDGTFDVVFRYEDIDWTSGDLQGGFGGTGGTPAVIGFRMSDSGAVTVIGPSGDEDEQLGLPGTLGNTGVAGLWVFTLGGAGDPPETVTGGGGTDTLSGTTGDEVILALGGDDFIYGSSGADTIDGGDGFDVVDFSLATAAVRLDLAVPGNSTGWADGDVYLDVEAFYGGAFNDTMQGSTLAEELAGFDGNDSLRGGDGGDTLWGEAGRDTLLGEGGHDLLRGGTDNDSLAGGAGNDTLQADSGQDSLSGDDGSDWLDGGPGADLLYGGAGDDTLIGGLADQVDSETLQGGGGNDKIVGKGGTDLLYGGDGDDSLVGNDGWDTLNGEGGNDTLLGGLGSDHLYGGEGADDVHGGGGAEDTVFGGSGADRFLHSGLSGDGTDRVEDYAATEGDVLTFLLPGAEVEDFILTTVNLAGMGASGLDEVQITYAPTGQVIWTLVDAEDATSILLQTDGGTFELL